MSAITMPSSVLDWIETSAVTTTGRVEIPLPQRMGLEVGHGADRAAGSRIRRQIDRGLVVVVDPLPDTEM